MERSNLTLALHGLLVAMYASILAMYGIHLDVVLAESSIGNNTVSAATKSEVHRFRSTYCIGGIIHAAAFLLLYPITVDWIKTGVVAEYGSVIVGCASVAVLSCITDAIEASIFTCVLCGMISFYCLYRMYGILWIESEEAGESTAIPGAMKK